MGALKTSSSGSLKTPDCVVVKTHTDGLLGLGKRMNTVN